MKDFHLGPITRQQLDNAERKATAAHSNSERFNVDETRHGNMISDFIGTQTGRLANIKHHVPFFVDQRFDYRTVLSSARGC